MVGQRNLLGAAVQQRELEAEFGLDSFAVASTASELSIPTGRAPRRTSRAETYAVPQPSSITSSASTSSGSIWTWDSGTPQILHAGSLLAQL